MAPKSGRAVFLGALLLIASGMPFAQSNEEIDILLSQNPAQVGHAAYLVLTAAGIVEEDATPSDALSAAQKRGMISTAVTVDDPVRFGDFAYMLTDSFGVSGGLMYRLIPGPRYAAREVVSQGWSRSRRATGEKLDGDTVTRIMSVYLNEEGGNR